MSETNSVPAKPVPVINTWAQPFWDACKEQRLIIQHCKDCGQHIFYPRIACTHCASDNLEWVESTGRGVLYSFTVVYNNAPSAFAVDVPYVVAVVKLEEGVQMLSNIIDCDLDDLHCDMPVKVVFEALSEDITLPKFTPVQS